jgi:GxxExxY protein
MGKMDSGPKPRSAEEAEGTPIPRLTEKIIGAAIEVHRHTGPGLLESAYEECLCFELSKRALHFRRQVLLPVSYKGIKLDCGYKIDLLVEDSVVLELKTVDHLLPIHSAQLLTYLKLSGKPIGLLINFNEPVLKNGLKRLVNHFNDSSTVQVPSFPSARKSGEEGRSRPQLETLKTRHLSVSAVK